jgi:hypothetical protein
MSVVPTTPAAQPNQQTPGVFKTFRALRHRDFRLLWVGLAVSAVGTWMQIVAQSLLVLKITHGSAFALGTVSLAQALAFFLFASSAGASPIVSISAAFCYLLKPDLRRWQFCWVSSHSSASSSSG